MNWIDIQKHFQHNSDGRGNWSSWGPTSGTRNIGSWNPTFLSKQFLFYGRKKCSIFWQSFDNFLTKIFDSFDRSRLFISMLFAGHGPWRSWHISRICRIHSSGGLVVVSHIARQSFSTLHLRFLTGSAAHTVCRDFKIADLSGTVSALWWTSSVTSWGPALSIIFAVISWKNSTPKRSPTKTGRWRWMEQASLRLTTERRI